MIKFSGLLLPAHIWADVESVFDASWYLNYYPDVASAGVDALSHYLVYGASEGRNPNPLFETSWYIEQAPKISRTGLNPLLHYLTEGFREGRNPHPLFTTSWYVDQYPSVAAAGINPLVHYLKFGARAAYDPHPLFNTAFYLKQNPDVAAANLNPLAHYLIDGEKEGRSPNPLFDVSWYRGQCLELPENITSLLIHYLTLGSDQRLNPHPLFDTSWYLKQIQTSFPVGNNVLEHYLRWGARDKLEPHPLFDAAWYLQTYPEVREAGVNPLTHYLEEGSDYGTEPHPLFRGNWYKQRYGSIQSNPLVHYILHGAKNYYDPSPAFSTRWYTTRYKDVERMKLNPLVHYVTIGRFENRATLPIEIVYRNHIADRHKAIARTVFERRRHMDLMPRKPLFLIIVNSTVENDFNTMLSCLAAQMYSKFEIVPAEKLRDQIDKYAAVPDVFIMWLDSGDVLKDTALYSLARVINQFPDLDVVYGDEEAAIDDCKRITPFFKPGWSADYLESFNYVGRAVCYRLSVAGELALCSRTPFDLLLKVSESTERIVHLREVIIRSPDRRFGTDEQIHSDVADLESRNTRLGRKTKIYHRGDGSRLYFFEIEETFEPPISLVAINSSYEINCQNFHKDDSSQESYKSSSRLGGCDVQTLFVGERLGCDDGMTLARSLNDAANQASGEFILFVRDGLIPTTPGLIKKMLRHFIKPHVGAVGPKIFFQDGRIMEFGQILCDGMACSVLHGCEDGVEDYFFAQSAVRNVRALGLNALFTRTSNFRDVGGFSERMCDNLIAVDYCMKLVASGLRIVCDPDAKLMNMAIGDRDEARAAPPARNLDAAIYEKWSSQLIAEPFYNNFLLSTSPAAYDSKQ